MESPVSANIANLVMEELESKALISFIDGPKLFYQFVDDTISAFKKTRISGFHEHLNNQNGNTKFTIEMYDEK